MQLKEEREGKNMKFICFASAADYTREPRDYPIKRFIHNLKQLKGGDCFSVFLLIFSRAADWCFLSIPTRLSYPDDFVYFCLKMDIKWKNTYNTQTDDVFWFCDGSHWILLSHCWFCTSHISGKAMAQYCLTRYFETKTIIHAFFSCRDVCLLPSTIELNDTLLVVLRAPKNI